jgi:metallophosphoesterase (TIGR00282 family)
MKVFFVGDIVGRRGRKVVRRMIPALRRENDIDLIIANVENSAGGFGITPAIAREILAMGVDVMTSGNHIWDKKEVLQCMGNEPRLLRPHNYPPGVPGSGAYEGVTRQGIRFGVLNLQGRVFMPNIDCPFRCAEEQVSRLRKRTEVLIVDFHAEATSEKLALGWFLDGRVSAVLGTHTHVPTADTRLFPKGTAYVSDVGMTGCYDSVIGVSVETALPRFLTGMPTRFAGATGLASLASVLLDIDESTGLARSIRRIGPDLPMGSSDGSAGSASGG